MKNQRQSKKEKPNFSRYGFTIVSFGKEHDFCIRNITAAPGKLQVFDAAINGNYTCIKVIDGFDKQKVRSFVEEVVWEEDDFMVCTIMNYWNGEDLEKAIVRKYGY
jgi:hypothetical protein